MDRYNEDKSLYDARTTAKQQERLRATCSVSQPDGYGGEGPSCETAPMSQQNQCGGTPTPMSLLDQIRIERDAARAEFVAAQEKYTRYDRLLFLANRNTDTIQIAELLSLLRFTV